jgi:hypothetical protein
MSGAGNVKNLQVVGAASKKKAGQKGNMSLMQN